jgi:hypothetical protein
MALEEGLVFAVTASAYRNGVMDRGMALFGDALDSAMSETGCELGDLVNRMDEAGARTVMRIDGLLARSGPLLRVAANDRLMALVSRLLDISAVRRAGVAVLRRLLVRVVTAADPEGGRA